MSGRPQSLFALTIPRQYRTYKPRPPDRDVIGFDTEWIDGYARLICTSEGDILRTKNLEDILQFMFYRPYRETLNVFFNIQADITAILKYLPINQLKRIATLGKCEIFGYELEFIPRKYFSIKRKKHLVKYFDAFQFYKCSLDKASKDELGEGKDDLHISEYDTETKFNNNIDIITKYCIQDCVLVKRLMERLQHRGSKLKLSFNAPYSEASVAREWLLRNAKIPIFKDKTAQALAYNAYRGGRFEVFKRGYVPKGYVYDITSAYPKIQSELPDLSNGEWKNDIEVHWEADLGFCECHITANPEYIGVFPFMQKNLVTFPCMNKLRMFTTLEEMRVIEDYDLALVEPINGWYYHANDDFKPYAIMKDLFKERMKLKDAGNSLEKMYKILLNSPYGQTIMVTKKLEDIKKLIEGEDVVELDMDGIEEAFRVIYKTGQLFNPAYASTITGNTRARLMRKMLEKPKDVIATFTDSVFSTSKLRIDEPCLGAWEEEMCGEMIILGSGVYTVENNKKVKTRFRGVMESSNLNLFDLLADTAEGDIITIPKSKMVQLKESLVSVNRYTKEDINMYLHYVKSININFDRKRQWNRDFTCAQDASMNLIDSLPLPAPVVLEQFPSPAPQA